GHPGPERRHVVLQYAELIKREVEHVVLSSDITEADLKQRREITKGTSGFSNQAPVRAALSGRLLILEGLEKVERNVLPALNNLLENREMAMDDGSFLISHTRFDDLIDEGQTAQQLEERGIRRVHPDFRVVALALPVPPYPGRVLDPPLRSRFQGRVFEGLSPGSMLQVT
ncbi:unnamed protein product, partial [Chrysoparadoxa australica]